MGLRMITAYPQADRVQVGFGLTTPPSIFYYPYMPPPAWRPPPDTSHLDEDSKEGMLEAARLRNGHRRLMAIRWRNLRCRAMDRRFGRLPDDWHDWMRCPAPEGYQTMGCTCDSWTKKKGTKPRQVLALQHTGAGSKTPKTKGGHLPSSLRMIKSIDLQAGVLILSGHVNDLQTGSITDPKGDYLRYLRPKAQGLHYTKPTWLWKRRCCVPRV